MQDALITEKGKVVNELNRQLEEAQRRVRDLANSVDNQESVHLKIQVEQLSADRKALEQKLSEASVSALLSLFLYFFFWFIVAKVEIFLICIYLGSTVQA